VLPRFPLVVFGLIAVNTVVFVHELTVLDPNVYVNALAVIPYDITHGITLPPPSPGVPALTLVTALFVHENALHILGNMCVLVVFGPGIEALCGPLRFVTLYLICGIAGGLAMISIDPASHVPEFGASGAIAGLLGAYIVNFPRVELTAIVPAGCLPGFMRLPAFVVIGVWAAIQFVHGFGPLSGQVSTDRGGTAYFAHIGGFCAGVLLSGLFRRPSLRARRARFRP
jgi:membrane associated rhomboid family serine protease